MLGKSSPSRSCRLNVSSFSTQSDEVEVMQTVSKALARRYHSNYDATDESTQLSSSTTERPLGFDAAAQTDVHRGPSQDSEVGSSVHSSTGSHPSSGHQLVVKNVFLTVTGRPEEEVPGGMMACALSDSEICSHSGSRSSDQEGSRSISRTGSVSRASSDVDSRLDDVEEEEFEPYVQDVEWSAGSALHATKQCTPCIYVQTAAGCSFGADCKYCHMKHICRTRRRPSKSARSDCKRTVTLEHTIYVRQTLNGEATHASHAASGSTTKLSL